MVVKRMVLVEDEAVVVVVTGIGVVVVEAKVAVVSSTEAVMVPC